MKVKITKANNKHDSFKVGEVYEAEMYDDCKVSLLKRIPDGFDPEMNAYIHSVLFQVNGKWVKKDCGCCTVYE